MEANTLLSILMVVFEYSSAILTIIRSIQAFRAGGPWRNQKSGFLYLIFEQGVFYFSVVSLFTTGAVVLNFRAPAGSFFQRFLNGLTLPLSGLLTARFLLHLRRWESEHSHSATVNDGSIIGQESTMGGFRAAPGVLSTIIDDFGVDPVAFAKAGGSQRSQIALEEPESPVFGGGTSSQREKNISRRAGSEGGAGEV
ncbi:hypothetical protein E1B28_000040 [Marasmius oreades]|uniref:Uncharacterized protein n=1 Tax=Marasmius oreades TaxID=181124 RepID=A0A9P8ADS0_9AGAR|nr:uncharacterized protein E1B28_000040 [Marasmius oreades]KAG7098066.1 hypothetical protein E1B28_000040 [Marasmius oreades]